MLLSLWSSEAYAQTVTLNPSRIQRRRAEDPPGTEYDERNTRPWWISYEDCLRNEVFDFPIAVDIARDTLEVWAGSGTDCYAARPNMDRMQCWLLAKVEPSDDSFTVSVPVRNIVQQRLNTLNVPENVGEDVCNPSSSDSDGTQVTLHFFIVDGNQPKGTEAKWDAPNSGGIGFDLVGPSPPGEITVGMGESQLIVNVRNIGEDTDRERFSAYCERLEPGETCMMTELVRGQLPPLGLACGEASETSQTIRTRKNLDNGYTYAVAVAGEDIIGNPGVLSNVECATPLPLDDFYEIYTRNGGPGGGGFCNLRPVATRSPGGALLVLGAALAGLGLRRRRKRA